MGIGSSCFGVLPHKSQYINQVVTDREILTTAEQCGTFIQHFAPDGAAGTVTVFNNHLRGTAPEESFHCRIDFFGQKSASGFIARPLRYAPVIEVQYSVDAFQVGNNQYPHNGNSLPEQFILIG